MDDFDRALLAYESALRCNPTNLPVIQSLAAVLMSRDQFLPALDLLQRYPQVESTAEQIICLLGLEELGRAHVLLEAKKAQLAVTERALWWWACGLYHDRMGLELPAIDAYQRFLQLERDQNSALSREAHYRLAVLYRLQGQFQHSRACLEYLKTAIPVRRSAQTCFLPGPCWVEVALQSAILDEAEGSVRRAKSSLERLLLELSAPQAAPLQPLLRCRSLLPRLKQRLGCLALTGSGAFENDSIALGLLLKATEEDPSDALNWHYLGRLYLLLSQPAKAYDAYQQAVYRDGRNAAFWNSIGILYAGMGQHRDALDAYTRAVHHAPTNAVIWFNLHLLYEACNGAGSEDAREALSKARLFGLGAVHADKPIELEAANFAVRSSAGFGRPVGPGSGARISTKGQQQAALRRATGVAAGVGTGRVMPSVLVNRR